MHMHVPEDQSLLALMHKEPARTIHPYPHNRSVNWHSMIIYGACVIPIWEGIQTHLQFSTRIDSLCIITFAWVHGKISNCQSLALLPTCAGSKVIIISGIRTGAE